MLKIYCLYAKNSMCLLYLVSLALSYPISTILMALVLCIMYKDYHHDILFPSSMTPAEIIQRANAIWSQRGIRPKQHLSEPRPGAVTLMERRAHSDRCENLPVDLPNDMGERRYSTFI
jgi:hypothetical protein